MQSRVRLLAATTFKYRGAVHPISDDYVRDTGYLWKNIPQKPELGRIRCWFSAHEQLSAAFVKSLPDEALPIPQGWERVDGLCSIDGSWSLEFPRRVATLKYYGEALRNCVGGYGSAIKSGRSVIFVVRERGILTIAVVTKPFHFEGQRRMQLAEQGVRVAKASALPTVSLSAGYNTAFSSALELGFSD